VCMFYGRAGQLDEFCFRRKKIKRSHIEYARDSYRDEFCFRVDFGIYVEFTRRILIGSHSPPLVAFSGPLIYIFLALACPSTHE
jgi:hypothetical protein